MVITGVKETHLGETEHPETPHQLEQLDDLEGGHPDVLFEDLCDDDVDEGEDQDEDVKLVPVALEVMQPQAYDL